MVARRSAHEHRAGGGHDFQILILGWGVRVRVAVGAFVAVVMFGTLVMATALMRMERKIRVLGQEI